MRLLATIETGNLQNVSQKNLEQQIDYLAHLNTVPEVQSGVEIDFTTPNILDKILEGLKNKYRDRSIGDFDRDYKNVLDEVSKRGKGIMEVGMTKQPKFHRKGHQTLMLPREGNRRIVGRGVTAKPKPRYAQFGKFIIHLPSLNRGVLNLKYTSMSNIINIPQQSISTDMVDFIHDLLDSGVINKNLYYKLSKGDQRLFTKVAGMAEIDDGMGYKNSFHEDEKQELDRFNLVKGIFLAGNNAPEVIKELQGFIRKFLNEGKISKGEGLTLLQETSCIA